MIENILNVVQIILAVLMIVFILLQARGAGLGGVFGGGGGNVFSAKRGVEKKLYQATVAIAILFFAVALANALI